MSDIVQELRTALTGWKACFGIPEALPLCAKSTNGCDGGYDATHGNRGGQRGWPRYFRKRGGQRARGLKHKQECAWLMAIESNVSAESGSICNVVSSNAAARIGTGQASMRSTMIQGTAGYVTRMSGGVGGRGREASSYPD